MGARLGSENRMATVIVAVNVLRAEGSDGQDVSRELFELRDGVLRTRRETIPIMITNDPGIALSDCLFYVVRALDAP